MALFEWTESCGVNVPEFDRDHQYIFSLVNHLHETMLRGQGRLLIASTLGELIHYAQTHFAAESAFMQAAAFAGREAHDRQHAEFTRQVEEFQRRFAEGTTDLTVEVMSFIEDWLRNHIQHVDKLYAPIETLPPLPPATQRCDNSR